MITPGKYNAEATKLREETNAGLVFVLVLRGAKGDGSSLQTTDPRLAAVAAKMLRIIADGLDADVAALRGIN